MSSKLDAPALLCRNAVDVIDREELALRLSESAKSGKPLRIKAGFDPSAPDIHLGHTVLLRKLRQFQDLGHKVILLIGDTTALIGDPTGQSKTRPVLSKEQVAANAKTYQDQAFKILDPDPQKIEVVYNSKWLTAPQMLVTFLQISGRVTVDQLLVRDDFDKRRKAHRPIAVQELFYPIMQGYDSVEVKADVELGGTDQLFNLLMGREIQSQFGQKPQIVMTLPLLVGLDGVNKMSKSLGNYIAVNDSAKDMFGKTMSVPDALMKSYFDLLTSGIDISTLGLIQSDPRNAKVLLAKKIVEQYYGIEAAENEEAEFNRIFRDKQKPADIPKIHLGVLFHNKKEWQLLELVYAAKFSESKSEIRRKIEEGAVTLCGVKVVDPKAMVTVKTGDVLKVGKLFFKELVID